MVLKATLIIFLLVSMNPCYGFWEIFLTQMRDTDTMKTNMKNVADWVSGKPVDLDPASQYIEMWSIHEESNDYLSEISKSQKQEAQDTKETNKYIKKLNDISSYVAEQTQLISKQTNIKLSTPEEAFEFFTNIDKAKEKTTEGLLSRDFFKRNPEYANGLKKVMNGDNLRTSDLLGILDVIILGEESDLLLSKRLLDRGYSKNQVTHIMIKVKQIRLIQQEIADDNTILLKNIATLERYKQTQNKTHCNILKQDQQKNECLKNLYAMDSNIVEQTRLIMDLKKQINEKIAKNDALLSYIRNYEIVLDNENFEKQKMKDENELYYLSQKNKAHLAESKLDDFINFTQFHIGRGY